MGFSRSPSHPLVSTRRFIVGAERAERGDIILGPLPHWLSSEWQSLDYPAIEDVEAFRQWIDKQIMDFRGYDGTSPQFVQAMAGIKARQVDDAHLLVDHLVQMMGWRDVPERPQREFIGADASVVADILSELGRVRTWIERCLEQGRPVSHFQPGVTGLTGKQRAAFAMIASLKKPMKGPALARRIGVKLTTFKKHYLPVLRLHGLKRNDDGYYLG